MNALIDELALATNNITQKHLDDLAEAGIWRRTLYDFEDGRLAGHFGFCQIEPQEDRTYQPAETDPDAVVIGVLDRGDLTDLLAFHLSDPARWWLRCGMAPILGHEAVERATFIREPLLVHPTPLDLLRGDCAGAVVLDWQAVTFWLCGIRQILTTCKMTRDRLKTAFRNDSPDIRIEGEEDHEPA